MRDDHEGRAKACLQFQFAHPARDSRTTNAYNYKAEIFQLNGGIPNQVTILDSQLMRVATGVGLQWISPFGPIRVDYAIPIQKEYFDKTENFRFSFGTRF